VNVFETLSEFELFPKLATELRLKIWNFAAYQPRLIEVEHARNAHRSLSVTTQSRLSPVVLRVCKESREEGLKVYSLTYFEVQRPPNIEYAIYYNPLSDIVHFGDNACLGSMDVLVAKDMEIPRVAINCWRDNCRCSDWNDQDPSTSLNNQYASRFWEIYILHGLKNYSNELLVPWGGGWPGCKGLKGLKGGFLGH
jgi:hypothetical protein